MFFTSDTHFSHDNILTLGEGRPFENIEEHNQFIVSNWNYVVKPHNVVWHLGDVVMGKREETLPILDRLNGYKVLIPGNHDFPSSCFSPNKRAKGVAQYGQYFQSIANEVVKGGGVVVSHYPPADIPDHEGKDRYAELRPVREGARLYLHGHSHQDHRVTEFPDGSVGYSVGVDAHHYTPVSDTEIYTELMDLGHEVAAKALFNTFLTVP